MPTVLWVLIGVVLVFSILAIWIINGTSFTQHDLDCLQGEDELREDERRDSDNVR